MLLCGIGGVGALLVGLVIELHQPADFASAGEDRAVAQRAISHARASGTQLDLTTRAPGPSVRPARAAGAVPPDDAVAPARPTRLSSVQARAQLLERLRASGRASEPWMMRAEGVLTAWRELAPQLAVRITAGPVDCFHDGCSVEIISADRAAFDQLNESLPASPAFIDFPGWRHRIGNTARPDGSVVSTWFFMRPDGPVAGRE